MYRKDIQPSASASCTFGPDEYWEKLVSDTDYRKKCRMTLVVSPSNHGLRLLSAYMRRCTEPGRGVDPLKCPTCGGKMKVISFIERHQTVVIEKILRHCGLWKETPSRATPRELPPTIQSSGITVDYDTVDYDFFQGLAG